jgi:prolipoprotein diacylglyceryltransferase
LLEVTKASTENNTHGEQAIGPRKPKMLYHATTSIIVEKTLLDQYHATKRLPKRMFTIAFVTTAGLNRLLQCNVVTVTIMDLSTMVSVYVTNTGLEKIVISAPTVPDAEMISYVQMVSVLMLKNRVLIVKKQKYVKMVSVSHYAMQLR